MTTRILFVCTGNIARSQMAEGLARAVAAPGVEVAGAGSRPNPKGLHSMAVIVLRDTGIDISGQRPKRIEDLTGEFDYVVTLCDDAAKSCPTLSARRERVHWSIPDPAIAGTAPPAVEAIFRSIRDDLDRRIREFLGARDLIRENAGAKKTVNL
jgi:arsenate reductase